MSNISTRFWDFIFNGKKLKVFIFVFSGAFILRLPTVFIDFVHIDVITTYLLVKKDLAGLFFKPNKGILYHEIYKFCVEYLADTPKSFHFAGIVIILLTMLFIYLLSKKIFNDRIGIVSAMLYGFIISSYNTEFLATNGEAVYNLFFIASFYFFYLVYFDKRYVFIIPLFLSITLGTFIKFQANYIIFFFIFYMLYIKPCYSIKSRPVLIKYLASVTAFFTVVLILLIIDWNYGRMFFPGSIEKTVEHIVSYVVAKGFSPVKIAGKLLWRSIQFILYHSLLWIPGIIAIIGYFKTKEKKEVHTYLVAITLFLFLTIFLSGSRLYIHYFITVMPTLAILASSEIYKRAGSEKFKKIAFRVFLIPVIFFMVWNFRDAYIANFAPQMRHNESKAVYFSRLILMGQYGEHIVPHGSILEVVKFLKEKTDVNEKIFTWPIGNEVSFFSKRMSATPNYWYNEKSLYGIVSKEKGDMKTFNEIQTYLIDQLRKSKTDYFVDVSLTSMFRKTLIYKKKDDPLFYFDLNTMPIIRFGSFGGLHNYPRLMKHIDRNYIFLGFFGKARVWKRVERKKRKIGKNK
ncbi:glycosyltransferase family 39 protein [Spirochaetota bacterium]